MQNLDQILHTKGSTVYFVEPETTVHEAVAMMNERHVGALPVMKGEKLVGIVSERDVARKVVLSARPVNETHVSDIMTSQVVVGQPQLSVQEAMTLMTDKRIRHLPIVANDRVSGMISIGDLVKAVIEEQKFIIHQLENYITT